MPALQIKPSTKPRIGITIDLNDSGGYSPYPWFACGHRYVCSVVEAGGIPILLAPVPSLVNEYVEMLDGLILSGNTCDIDPKYYGETEVHPTVKLSPERTDFEFKVFQQALVRKIPILGICGGMQLINVAFKGSLIQHIPDEVPNALIHQSNRTHPLGKPRHEMSHEINVVAGTLLYSIAQAEKVAVNSSHHQAIKKLGEGLVLSATSPEGVIEGIELKDHPFCLGVQWHPEYHVAEIDHQIFEKLVEAATK